MDRLDGACGKAEEVKRIVGPLRWGDEIDPVLDDTIEFVVQRFEEQLRILFTASLNRHSPHRVDRLVAGARKVEPLAVG